MKQKKIWKNLFQAIYHYFLFFSLTAFLVLCAVSVFVRTFSKDLGVELTGENLSRAAKLAFLGVIFLSLFVTMIDVIRRKVTTERLTKHIAAATKKMMQGNFDTRIRISGKLITDDHYNEIIEYINKMAEELGGLETLRTDFIANVSHEMKTPLAVIQNYGILLQTPDLTEEKRIEYAKGVTDGARRMADMVTNILKLNRLENQQIFSKTTEFDLGEQLCECLLQYENVWEKAGIELEADIAGDVLVSADRELLGLVWNNLFSNAFKFTPEGGKVSVSMKKDGLYAIVKVQDTGCGMSAEVGAHIFEKFYQGDTSHATQGNGLGLALVKRVVDILRGEISVESAVGEGTTFTVKMKI